MRKTTKCLFIGTTKLFCAYKASISLEIGLSFRFVESMYNSSGDLSDHHVGKYLVVVRQTLLCSQYMVFVF